MIHDTKETTTQAIDSLLETLEYPMVIVTATDGSRTAGCLVGLHTQASIDPMRIAVFLEHENHTYEVAKDATDLAVHYLDRSQHALAERFGSETGPEAQKFDGVDILRSENPAAIELTEIGHRWIGRIEETVDCGDHTMFLLAPTRVHRAATYRPLTNQAVTDIDPGNSRSP